MNRKAGLWIALWLALVVVTGYFAFSWAPFGMAHGPGWGRAEGWGGYGPAYRDRGWHGMAPGWMGGRQSDFDDEWGMGPAYGMMGPQGGMMPGMGYYAMPGHPLALWSAPDLTPAQSEKIGKLQNEWAERNRAAMRQISETQARLNSLYASEKRDWNAIRSAHQRLFDLQRQLSESAIDFQQKGEALLTDAQRREAARAWRSDDE